MYDAVLQHLTGAPFQRIYDAIASLLLAVIASMLLSAQVVASSGAAYSGTATTSYQTVTPPTPPLFGLHTEFTTDMKVKVLGGFVNVDRTWEKGRWTVNRRWSRLSITQSVMLNTGGTDFDLSSVTLNRNGTKFEYAGNNTFVDEYDPNYTITKTDTGYRWKDRQGNWIDYDSEGYLTSYGDANDVMVRLAYDENHVLTGVFDHLDHQVLWYVYGDNLLTIRDYTERQVQYIYENGELVKFIDPRGKEWSYTYENGDLKTKTDPLGRVTTIEYNANKSVSSITDPASNVTSYKHEYDKTKKEFYKQVKSPLGKVTETWLDAKGDLIRKDINGATVISMLKDGERKRIETDASGNQTVIDYDEWRNPLKKTNADGSIESWTYDTKLNKVLQHVDENGVITKKEYDAHGNLIKKTEALGKPEQRITRYTYDAYGQLLDRAVEDVVVAKMSYDEYGNVKTRTDGEGNTVTMAHDVLGNILTWNNPLGHVWTYTYDGAGNRLSMTDPLERAISYEYDVVGNRVKVIDIGGAVTEYQYNENDRIAEIINPLKQVTTISYNKDLQPTKFVNMSGALSEVIYDQSGRIASFHDASGYFVKIQYTNAGNLVSSVLTPSIEQFYIYDKRNRRIETSAALSDTARYVMRTTYDSAGNTVLIDDYFGRKISYEYDALARRIGIADPLGGRLKFQYDHSDNITSIADVNGGVIKFGYLKNGKKISVINALGGKTISAYDAVGNVVSKFYPSGRKVIYSYDEVNRQVKREYYSSSDARSPSNSVSFRYGDANSLIGYDDGVTAATYSYDQLNRLTDANIDYGVFKKSFSYRYGDHGKKSKFIDVIGNEIDYLYDKSGRLNSITIPGVGAITVNDYDYLLPTRITLPGGGRREFGRDGLFRINSVQGLDPAGEYNISHTYEYDLAGNVIKKNTEHGEYQYGYDILDRLVSASNPTLNDEAYTYDVSGNRLTDANQSGEWNYNLDNQLLAIGENATYQYDSVGRLISHIKNGVERSYLYGHDGRLREITENGAAIGQYQYDPFGRRISKVVNGVKTWFLYNNEGLIGEFDRDGNVVRQYGMWPCGVWGSDPVYMQDSESTYFFYNDYRGTPQKLVSVAGKVVWSAHYDSFGFAHQGVQIVHNPLRSPGQYYDQETNFHYNFNRYYDPAIGRYVSRDSLGQDEMIYLLGENYLAQDVNQYVYVRNNPLRYVDDNGEVVTAIGGLVGGAIAGAVGGAIGTLMTDDASFSSVANAIWQGALWGGTIGFTAGLCGGCAAGIATGVGIDMLWAINGINNDCSSC